MVGKLSSLGIGSGLNLQSTLDQLKELELQRIETRKTEQTKVTKQLSAYNTLNAELLGLKAFALDLSLESEFLDTKVSVSDEDILSATTKSGVSLSGSEIEIEQKATHSSFVMKNGEESGSAVPYGYVEGIKDPATEVVDKDMTYVIKKGSPGNIKEIKVPLKKGMSLKDVADAINKADANKGENGEKLVNAALHKHGDKYSIRVSSATGGSAVDSQIVIPTGSKVIQADSSISFGLKGTDKKAFVNIPPGASWESVVKMINESPENPGVKASVINDGSSEKPYKVVLTSKETGESNRIVLGPKLKALFEDKNVDENGNALSLNAKLKVNGVSYEREKNAGITDVVSGVSLTLKKEGKASVAVTRNTDNIKDNIKKFIEKVNTLVKEIDEHHVAPKDELGNTSDSETEKKDDDDDDDSLDFSALKNSFTARDIASQLKALVTSEVDNPGSYESLAEIGMSFSKDGTISLDEKKLDQVLAEDPEGIRHLFLGNEDRGVKGLGDIFNDGITGMVKLNGSLNVQVKETKEKLERMTENIETEAVRINEKFERMAAQFVQLDVYISKMQKQGNVVTSMVESFKKSNNS